MATVQTESSRELQFFVEIIDSFKIAGDSTTNANYGRMKVTPFVDAMTMFLRIFDAFSNPFFSDVVKKDVQGNISKLRASAQRHNAETLEDVIDLETRDPKDAKMIKKETGEAANSGTVALLWMKRTMQFVCGLLRMLVNDPEITLASASRKSYQETLRYCHNIITRGVFDTGLRFAPARESFYKNLAGGSDISEVGKKLAEFLELFSPQLNGIVEMYWNKDLEPYIKKSKK